MKIHYLFEEANPSFRKAQDDPNFPYLNSASARFAGTYPGEVLRAQGHGVQYHFVNKNTGVRDDIAFEKDDVVVCVRNYFQEMVDTAKLAKEKGAIIVMQQNDPHILSTEESLAEVRSSHLQLLKMSDAVIACSPSLAELCAQYNPVVEVIFDGVDTQKAEPAFDLSQFPGRPLHLTTPCYGHNHGDILNSLPSIEAFAVRHGQVEYSVVTKPPRADQRHHGNDYDSLAEWKSESEKLSIRMVDYSPQAAALEIAASDMVVLQEDSGNRKGYKADWYPKKSNGRGAAAIWAGKPIYCPRDILSYQPFLNGNGGFNKGNVGLTLEHMLSADPTSVNEEIRKGQILVEQNNSSQIIAAKQLALFQKLIAR